MRKKIHLMLRNGLGLTQKEIAGFAIVLCLLMCYLFVHFTLYHYNYPQISVIDSAETARLQRLMDQMYSSNTFATTLVPFNPNMVNSEEWQALGLERYLAERIIKYRKKGGKFYEKQDLKKIYGFPEDLYEQLYPYINIPKERVLVKKEKPAKRVHKKRKYQPQAYYLEKQNEPKAKIFEINAAKPQHLMQVKGIGEKLAKRIINFRAKLGGFYHKLQIDKVYHLPPDVAEKLKECITLDTALIKKIPINFATVKELSRHPYIQYKMATIIVNYREQHGFYRQMQDLYAIKIFNPQQLQKIQPYLSFAASDKKNDL